MQAFQKPGKGVVGSFIKHTAHLNRLGGQFGVDRQSFRLKIRLDSTGIPLTHTL